MDEIILDVISEDARIEIFTSKIFLPIKFTLYIVHCYILTAQNYKCFYTLKICARMN